MAKSWTIHVSKYGDFNCHGIYIAVLAPFGHLLGDFVQNTQNHKGFVASPCCELTASKLYAYTGTIMTIYICLIAIRFETLNWNEVLNAADEKFRISFT